MAKVKIGKSSMRLVFLATAVTVGAVIGAKAIKNKGELIKDKGKKVLKKVKKKMKDEYRNLNNRQQKILDVLEKKFEITSNEVNDFIKGVTRRTLRRDLTDLENKGYIKQKGKTRGSYYVLGKKEK